MKTLIGEMSMLLRDIFLYLNFAFFVFALPFFAAIRWNIRPEKSFFPALILNSMIFYFFAIFHKSTPGFWIIYSVNMALYLPFIFIAGKKKREELLQNVFTPGFVILFAMLTVFFFFTRTLICYSWDAISHWMTIVKFFFAEEKLCCEYSHEIVKHASYPPGMSMTAVLVHKCFFGEPFRESLVILAYILPMYGAFAWFFSKLNWNQNKAIMIGVITASLITPLLYCTTLYDFCYTDFCLAAVMAITFYQLITLRDYEVPDLILLALLNGWLFMIRNSGWGYSLAIMAFFAVFLFRDRKKAFYAAENTAVSKSKLAAAVLVFILPFLMKYSWVYLLNYYSTTLKFGGTNITGENFYAAFSSFDARGWKMLWGFLWRSLLMHAPALILIILIARKAYRNTSDAVLKRGLKVTLWFFVPGAILYLGTMFFYYVFEFSEKRAYPSMNRYFFSFAIVPAFIIILILMEMLGSKSAGEQEMIKYSRKKVFRISAIVIIFCTFASFLISHKKHYILWRKECNLVQRYEYLFKPGVKYGHITTTGNGFKSYYMQYLYPYHHSQPFPFDPVLPGSPVSEVRIYSEQISPEDLREKFKLVDYIFIDNPEEDFSGDFQTVFVDEFKPDRSIIQKRMFKVTPEGKLKPVD